MANWQIDWGNDPPVFGFDFAMILLEGIEQGVNHLEYVISCGKFCDGCGRWSITHKVDSNERTPTDRGTEFRFITYDLCDWCHPAF